MTVQLSPVTAQPIAADNEKIHPELLGKDAEQAMVRKLLGHRQLESSIGRDHRSIRGACLGKVAGIPVDDRLTVVDLREQPPCLDLVVRHVYTCGKWKVGNDGAGRLSA